MYLSRVVETKWIIVFVYSLFVNLVWFWFSELRIDGNVN